MTSGNKSQTLPFFLMITGESIEGRDNLVKILHKRLCGVYRIFQISVGNRLPHHPHALLFDSHNKYTIEVLKGENCAEIDFGAGGQNAMESYFAHVSAGYAMNAVLRILKHIRFDNIVICNTDHQLAQIQPGLTIRVDHAGKTKKKYKDQLQIDESRVHFLASEIVLDFTGWHLPADSLS